MMSEQTEVAAGAQPEQVKIDFSGLPDKAASEPIEIDFSGLPDKAHPLRQDFIDAAASGEMPGDSFVSQAADRLETESVIPEVTHIAGPHDFGDASLVQGKDSSSMLDRFLAHTKISPEQAANAYALSRYGNDEISPSMALEHYDDLSKQYFEAQTIGSPRQIMQSLTPGMLAVGFAAHPLAAVQGLGYFMALDEAENAAVSYLQDTPHRFGEGKNLTNLLPYDTNQATKGIVEILDFIGKAMATKRLMNAGSPYTGKAKIYATETARAFFRDIQTKYGTPQVVYVDPSFVSDILKGTSSNAEQLDLWHKLGLSADEIRKAKNLGFQLEIPTERLVTVVDQPWWAKFKEAIGVNPYEDVLRAPLSPEEMKAQRKITPIGGLLEEAPAASSPEAPAPSAKPSPGAPAEPIAPAPAAAIEPAPAGQTLYQTELQAMKFFKSRGWTHEQAAGIVGNLSHESAGMQPYIKQAGGSGFGLAQWTSKDRVKALFEYASSKGEKIPSFETQLEFVDQELRSTEKVAGDALASAKTVEEATQIVSNLYERPGKPMMESRLKRANAAAGITPEQLAAAPEGGRLFTRESFRDALSKASKISPDQVDTVMELADSAANAWAETEGKSPSEWYTETFKGVEVGGKPDGTVSSLSQTAIEPDDPRTIFLSEGKKANPATVLTSPQGSREWGKIDEEAATAISRQPGDIRLQFGSEAEGQREGWIHIKNSHEKGILSSGYQDVDTFVHDVTSNYTQIRQGRGTGLILVKQNGQAKLAIVELTPSAEGDFYRIKNAWPVREKYLESMKVLWERRAPARTSSGVNPPLYQTPDKAGGSGSALGGQSSSNVRAKGKPVKTKGAVQFAEDGRALIHLFKNADVTTIVHELWHVLARQLNPNDLAVINAWLGADPNATLDDWTTDQHEKFARGGEAFIMEGKAPSSKLRHVFAKLRHWLLATYKSIKRLGVELTDEVRGVFDRLLSTEAERKADVIAQMNEEYMFIEPADSTVTIETIQNYEQLMAIASRDAWANVEAKRRAKQEKLEREWRKQAAQMILEDPVQAAKIEIAKRGGLNEKILLQDYDRETVKELNRIQCRLVSKNGKLAPDVAAMDMGFESLDALIQAVLEAPMKDEAIERQIDYFRQEQKEDRDYDQADMHLALIEEEIRIFEKLTETSTAKMKNRTDPAIKAKVARGTGRRTVGEVRSVTEYHALKAAMRAASIAARTAFAAGRREEALRQKEKQRDIAAEYKERLRERREFKRITQSLQKMLDDKKVDWTYREKLVQLLSPFNIRKVSKQAQADYAPLRQFLNELEQSGEAVFIDRDLLDRIESKSLNQLTFDELNELYDAATHLHHLGKLEHEFAGELRRVNFNASKIRIINSIFRNARTVDRGPQGFVPPSSRAKTGLEAFLDAIDRQHMDLIQPEFLIRLLDGFHEMGPAYQELWLEVKKAEDAKLRLGAEIEAKIREIFEPHKDELSDWSRIKHTIAGLPWPVTRQELIMIALNAQHPNNLAALMSDKGNGMSEAEIAAAVNSLSPEEETIVRKITDELIPILRPLLQQSYKDLTGAPLKMVEGTYFPIIFDRAASDWIDERRTAKEAENAFKDYFPTASVTTGSTKERTGGKLPILLHLSGLVDRIYSDLQYATHAVAVRNLLKLLNDNDIKAAITAAYGENVYDQFKPWLKEVANPGGLPMLPFEPLVGAIRRNAVLHIMAFRVSTALQQPLAILQVMEEIGPTWAIKGIDAYLESPKEKRAFIYERSPFMAERPRSFDRDIAAVAGSLFDMKELERGSLQQKGHELQQWIGEHGMALTAFMDSVAAECAWLGAYSKAMSGEVENIAEGDEDRTIDYADGVVGRTQGAGNPKNLAAISRGNEFTKIFITFFYTFFNTMHNKTWEAWRKYRAPTNEYNLLDLMKSLFLLTVIPGIVNEVVNKREKTTVKGLAVSPLKYWLSGIPLMRDIATGIFDGYDYRGGLMGNVIEQGKRLVQALNAKGPDKSKAVASNILKATGYATGLPPDQFIIIMEMALDANRGRKRIGPDNLIWRRKE